MFDGLTAAFYRIRLVARDPLCLPPFKGSPFRGALINTFRSLVCFERARKECGGCPLESACHFPVLFACRAPEGVPGTVGFESFPRPFVVEPPDDLATEIPAGEEMKAGLVLVGRAMQLMPYFLLALREMAARGVGRGRGRVLLAGMEAVNPLTGGQEQVYRAEDATARGVSLPITHNDVIAAARALDPNQVTVRFVTPTHLRKDRQMVRQPDFEALVRALLRRLSALSKGHCGHVVEADWGSLVEQAKQVELVASDLRTVTWEHHSSRQGRSVPHVGFVGSVTYRGDLSPFLEALLWGSILHVGDSCVFGMGRYELPS